MNLKKFYIQIRRIHNKILKMNLKRISIAYRGLQISFAVKEGQTLEEILNLPGLKQTFQSIYNDFD